MVVSVAVDRLSWLAFDLWFVTAYLVNSVDMFGSLFIGNDVASCCCLGVLIVGYGLSSWWFCVVCLLVMILILWVWMVCADWF